MIPARFVPHARDMVNSVRYMLRGDYLQMSNNSKTSSNKRNFVNPCLSVSLVGKLEAQFVSQYLKGFNQMRASISGKYVIILVAATTLLYSCYFDQQTHKTIPLVCDSLPDSEVDEIYMKTVNEIFIEKSIKHHGTTAIEIGLTKQQRTFLQPLYPNVNFVDIVNFRPDSRNTNTVVISIIWPAHVDSGQLSIGWNYSCGNACNYSGTYIFERYNGRWLLVDICKRGIS